MIIIQMAGGLGNQMFQYALYKQLESIGKNVKMDDEEGFREDAQREPALAPFGIEYRRASREEIMKITDSSPSFTAKVRRKLFGRHKKSYLRKISVFSPKFLTGMKFIWRAIGSQKNILLMWQMCSNRNIVWKISVNRKKMAMGYRSRQKLCYNR